MDALGQVLRGVLARGLALVVVGIVVSLAGAVAFTRVDPAIALRSE